jgi:hypothetical protein
MSAPAAELGCGRRKDIAACSARTGRCPVHRCRPPPTRRAALLRAVPHKSMANSTIQPSGDWLGSKGSSALAWWIPHAAILAGLFVPTPFRVVVWTVALIWMGAACILNARRCGRTHCRYTGPYYLAMIAPVLVLGSGMVSAGIYEWIVLGVIIVGGSKLIWWATERAWGKFS